MMPADLRALADRVDTILDLLRPIAAKANARESWSIEGDDSTYSTDYGSAWCDQCIYEIIDQLNLYTPSGAYEERGNDPSWPEDHCMHCAECGHLLEYSLTAEGAAHELEHYVENPPAATPEEAYHVVEMLDGLEHLDAQDLLLAIRIGLAILEALGVTTP